MKLRWLAGLSLVIVFCAGQIGAQETPLIKDQKDKVSYGIGMEIGRNLKRQSFDLNTELLLRGFKDAFSGEKALMTDQEITETMTAFQKEVMAKQQEAAKKLGEKNKAEGEAFLAENKKKEGSDNPSQRFAVQGCQSRVGQKTEGNRYGNSPIPGYLDRWNRVRQLVPPRSTGNLSRQRCDSRLDRSPTVDGRGSEMADLYPIQSRLWRTSCGATNRAECNSDF